MIEEKVKGREIEELVKRFAGASLLSKKSEEDAIKMLRGKEVSAWKIAATLVITGIKNFDVFDIDSLARGVDSSREEMINLVESLMERHLPIKIGKDYFNRNKKRLEKERKKIQESDEDSLKNQVELINDFMRRFNKWREKGWIILER